MKERVLFILKERAHYGSYGLLNSCSFIKNALVPYVDTKIVQVIDANSIDREVTLYRPDVVIIEALWVTPDKLKELVKLHKKVKWIVRIHSHIPFLATEGVSFSWLFDYVKIQNVYLASNDARIVEEFFLAFDLKILYLPNIYHVKSSFSLCDLFKRFFTSKDDYLDVGCFGALRLLKNHTEQALAAIIFAKLKNKKLRFHVNVPIESTSDANSILKNLRIIFKKVDGAELVEHSWLKHEDFIKLVKLMDIGMQLSFSETFNIVAADFVDNGVPIIVSSEIKFIEPNFVANPTDINDILRTLNYAYKHKPRKELLQKFNIKALEVWLLTLDSLREKYFNKRHC